MSLLSVSTQMYFECSLGSIVPAKLFSPPPKVDSQIVHLVRRELPLFNDREAGEVFRVIKAGFSNRRKTLLNSLSGGLAMPKEQVKLLVSSAAIDPAIRPQQLSVDEWIKLSAEFSNL
jgi:16S rRNA (adenine1518-N6/adenine1519-N6)-dimethyltransferase